MKQVTQLYINGQWVDAHGQGMLDVINPANNGLAGQVPNGNEQDVEAAVRAARRAFAQWSATSAEERAGYLRKLVALLEARQQDMAQLISSELGMPIKYALPVQVGLPIKVMTSYIDLAASMEETEELGSSLLVREPIGVCALITPWNYPLHQIVGKVAPALAAGCTVVLKPSREAPLNAFLLAELIAEVGLPPGVFNLVSGAGRLVGEALATHPDVDMVSFTGSTAAGIRVAELAARTVKRVCQELGGKSANILLPDADFETAVTHGVKDVCLNSGQTCAALTRMLVPHDRQEEAAEIAKRVAEHLPQGDPADQGSFVGPMVSETQRESVVKYILLGEQEGATLVTGGADKPHGHHKGAYVKPTVFKDVTNRMTIAQEEIFGPVLCIIPYHDVEEAIRIANDSPYGLSGAVWSADPEQAKKVALRMRTGQVQVNGGRFNPLAPFGGYKQSGNGRELGKFGLHEFIEIKSIQL